jgi:hypothetical protein
VIGFLHPTVAADLAEARRRDLLGEAASRRLAIGAPGGLRTWLGHRLISWGVRIAPEVRPLVCSEVSR